MQKNSYRFNFVQRSDIVIFCYCSICLPTCNSEMFHIPCRCIYTHVAISNVLYSLQFYIYTCLMTHLFWQKMTFPYFIWGSVCCILQSIAPCHLYDLNKIIRNYHVLLFTLSSKNLRDMDIRLMNIVFLQLINIHFSELKAIKMPAICFLMIVYSQKGIVCAPSEFGPHVQTLLLIS